MNDYIYKLHVGLLPNRLHAGSNTLNIMCRCGRENDSASRYNDKTGEVNVQHAAGFEEGERREIYSRAAAAATEEEGQFVSVLLFKSCREEGGRSDLFCLYTIQTGRRVIGLFFFMAGAAVHHRHEPTSLGLLFIELLGTCLFPCCVPPLP